MEVIVASPASAAAVVEALGKQHPELSALLPRSRVAVNQAYVDATTVVDTDDEIAIIPPVGGG